MSVTDARCRILLCCWIAACPIVLAERPASAGCTSSVHYVPTEDGGRLPSRRVRCPEPSAADGRRRQERAAAACRAVRLADACEQLETGRAAAIERHLARIARTRAARRTARSRASAPPIRSKGSVAEPGRGRAPAAPPSR
jgi:hypothetical protein